MRIATPIKPHLGAMLTLLAMAQFACMDALSKWLTTDFSVPQLMWVRALAFAALVVALQGRAGFVRAARSAAPLLQGAVALLLLIEGGCFVLAVHYLPLAEAHALAAVAPIIVVAFSAFVLRERIDAGRWGAVAAGCAGVFIILRPGFHDIGPALFFPLGCATLWATYQLSSRRCSQIDGPDVTMAWTAGVGLVATTLVLPWFWTTPDAFAGLLIVISALLGAGALYCLIRALDFAPASLLQPFNYSALVWVTILGFVFFGDAPDGFTLLGAAAIVSGGLYTWRRDEGARTAAAIVTPSKVTS